jgi:predicted MPP superfamily phosphohydrolase
VRLGFVFFALLVLGLPTAYVAWRLGAPVRDRGRRRLVRALWSVLPLIIVLEPLRWGLGWHPDAWWSRSLAYAAYVCMGVFSLVLTFTALRDLGWLALKVPRALPEDAERRRFLLGAANVGVLGSSAALGIVGYRQAVEGARVIEVPIPVRDLPASLEGFTIVQLSDVHIGPLLGREFLRGVVDVVNGLQPDLVAITGDLVDGNVDRIGHDVEPLKDLRSRHGTYFCTGNHEYYSGADTWCEHLPSLQMRVLQNEHEIVEHDGGRVLVAGVNDYRAARQHPAHTCDPATACAAAAPADVRVLLAHQPATAKLADGHDYDLMLSGHTHGGQFFPWNFLVHLVHEYAAGLYQRGKMWVYVNRGTGYWGPPLRIGTSSEITKLRLVRA